MGAFSHSEAGIAPLPPGHERGLRAGVPSSVLCAMKGHIPEHGRGHAAVPS